MGDDFYTAYDFLKEVEGFDLGVHQNVGESTVTYNGIYRKYWDSWEGWGYLDRGEIPPERLTRDFYRVNFWENKKLNCHLVPSGLNIILFDFAVNAGVTTSAKTLQKILGFPVDECDGWFGQSSVQEAIRQSKYVEDLKRLVRDFTRERIDYYYNLQNENFQKGWLNRSIDCDRIAYDRAQPF